MATVTYTRSGHTVTCTVGDPVDRRLSRLRTWSTTGDQDAPDVDERPAKNASRSVWLDYATAVGVEVDDEAARGDIIEAVDANG